MRELKTRTITSVVTELVKRANFFLRSDVLTALRRAAAKEKNVRAKDILQAILENAIYARKESLAICQDTGMPIVFVQIGQEVKISGDLKVAINKGIAQGYKKYFLRNSIVKNPLLRGKSSSFPAVIHIDMVKGSKIKLTFLPKGFGCENKSQLKMFKPTASFKEIKDFIIKVVQDAGPDACPPYIIGVGIGGTADYASFLAKKALLRPISHELGARSKLEKEILTGINALNIGPMGLGGKTTALAVNIESYPTHIAGLPVAVNISCHALRSAIRII